MSDKKLLSVVIPAYNAQNFIKESLDALLEQTYRNIEIIVVDDGSTDNTYTICQEYAKRDNRIKVYTHANVGVSATRNEGMDHATGEYIIFCDADDCPEPQLAERYIEAIEEWDNKDVSFITCGMYFDNYYNRNVKTKKYILESAHGYIEGENYLLSRSVAATLAWLKLFNFVTNKCYDLKFIKDNHIQFDKDIHIGEDLKFNLDYLDKCTGNIGMINEALYHYIKRSDESLSISYHVNDLEDTKYIYKRFVNWESAQEGVTGDNILVLKSIFINDWVSRMTSYYEEYRHGEDCSLCKRRLQKEIKSKEFQTMLSEIFKAKKISLLRYICLKTGVYEIFYFFRSIYQIIKG